MILLLSQPRLSDSVRLEGFGKGRAAKLAHGRLFGAARRGERAGALRRCDLIETSVKIGKSRRLMACPGDCLGLFPGGKILRSVRRGFGGHARARARYR